VAATGERVGKNEAVFREVNERIRELSLRLGAAEPGELVSFVCECSSVDCHETIELTLAEYEQVRSEGSDFIAAPGHLWEPQLEREVRRTSRYIVLRKLGEAGQLAEALDPRSDG
jgi:hypothetical protein